MSEFIDGGTYWLSIHEQGSDPWKQLRLQLLTASKFRRCRGRDSWSNLPQLILELQNGVDSTVINDAMRHGTATEPYARKWYEKFFLCSVRTVGLAIPKWNTLIGASPDGLIGDSGGLEIKCPKIMYEKIIMYVNVAHEGETESPYYWVFVTGISSYSPNVIRGSLSPSEAVLPKNYEHIKPEHFDQIQGCVAIYNREWWDYCVYATESDSCFVQRIPRLRNYWDTELYPDIQKFLSYTWIIK